MPGSGSVSYQYDAASRRTQMTVAGQTPVSYSYDNADRLTGITQGSSGVALAYDNANRRTTLTLPNGIQLTYGFDNANELTGLTYKLGATTVGNLTYAYDNDGRIITRGGTFDVTNLPATLASASYDANNRLTQWGAKTLSYDANGNLTGDGTNTYTWNTRNQLMNITGGSTASFVYDALGRRESKTIGGTATNFLYDGLNMEQELNGTTPTANYLTGANIDEVFSRTDSTGSYSYLTDNLGSSLALTNLSGAISTSYTYEPYGNTTTSGASSTNALQYTGRENDGTGLYYYRARYYSPAYGRFISQDPADFAGGINLYAYSLGNPITYRDSSGLLTGCEINWLNSNYGTVGGFIASDNNLQELIPGSSEYSPCDAGERIGSEMFQTSVTYILEKQKYRFLVFLGKATDLVGNLTDALFIPFATVAVWQAEMNCIDPITGRPNL
jgi:RHS repeat-associated protein